MIVDSMSRHDDNALISIRRYGSDGPVVLVLHGGPGAPGYMVPVARRLADHFQVIEPFQRHSETIDEPLTVARHVSDLHDVVMRYCPDGRPLLVGHSWGAMLALAYAAAYPDAAAAMVLIGCGTFDPVSREQMLSVRHQRTDAAMQAQLDELAEKYPDADLRLGAMGRLMQRVDSVDLVALGDKIFPCDAKGHEQTWADVLRLQEDGVYPQAFSSIHMPALMLHGDQDPHPGTMIYQQLHSVMPQLEYHAWPNCGHYPWLERAVGRDFYTVLTDWLIRQSR